MEPGWRLHVAVGGRGTVPRRARRARRGRGPGRFRELEVRARELPGEPAQQDRKGKAVVPLVGCVVAHVA